MSPSSEALVTDTISCDSEWIHVLFDLLADAGHVGFACDRDGVVEREARADVATFVRTVEPLLDWGLPFPVAAPGILAGVAQVLRGAGSFPAELADLPRSGRAEAIAAVRACCRAFSEHVEEIVVRGVRYEVHALLSVGHVPLGHVMIRVDPHDVDAAHPSDPPDIEIRQFVQTARHVGSFVAPGALPFLWGAVVTHAHAAIASGDRDIAAEAIVAGCMLAGRAPVQRGRSVLLNCDDVVGRLPVPRVLLPRRI